MNVAVSQQTLDQVFATLPIVILLIVVAVVYLLTRGRNTGTPIGQTFACARCGRRGAREHMVPQAHDGAVSWACARCAGH